MAPEAIATLGGIEALPTSSSVPPREMVAPLITAPGSMISVPPDATIVALAVPPDCTSSAPLPDTVVLVSVMPLTTSSVPPLTCQPLVALLVPVTVQVPPTTLKVVKPLYCVPIELRSNVSEPVPPSWNVLLPEGSTSPLIA